MHAHGQRHCRVGGSIIHAFEVRDLTLKRLDLVEDL
jgi:hypothetical protein